MITNYSGMLYKKFEDMNNNGTISTNNNNKPASFLQRPDRIENSDEDTAPASVALELWKSLRDARNRLKEERSMDND